MRAELGRARAGQPTRTGMRAALVHDFAAGPARPPRRLLARRRAE
jgi:hypothetical protein